MKKGIFAIVLLLALLNFAQAAELSITSVTIPTSVTQGGSFTITAYVNADSIQDVGGTISLPSGLSCTPTSSQSISLDNTTSGTGSASWSCSGDVAGSYSTQITVSVSGTSTSDSSSISDSEQTGLSVLSPASIVISGSLTSSSITTVGSTTLSIVVNNAGDVSTTVSIAPAISGVSFSPTSYTGISVEGSSLVTKTFTVSSTTAGTYTITTTVVSNDAGTSTTANSLTVTAVSSTATPTATPSTSTSGQTGNTNTQTTAPTPPPTTYVPPQITPTLAAIPTPTPKTGPKVITDASAPTPIPYEGEAIAQLSALDKEIADAKSKSLDTTEAEKLLATAKDYLKKGNFQQSVNTAKQAREIIAQTLKDASATLAPELQIAGPKGLNWTLIAAIILVVTAGVLSYIKFANMERMKIHHHKETEEKDRITQDGDSEKPEGKIEKAKSKGKARGEIDLVE